MGFHHLLPVRLSHFVHDLSWTPAERRTVVFDARLCVVQLKSEVFCTVDFSYSLFHTTVGRVITPHSDPVETSPRLDRRIPKRCRAQFTVTFQKDSAETVIFDGTEKKSSGICCGTLLDRNMSLRFDHTCCLDEPELETCLRFLVS